jgi:general secretion pathway protein C
LQSDWRSIISSLLLNRVLVNSRRALVLIMMLVIAWNGANLVWLCISQVQADDGVKNNALKPSQHVAVSTTNYNMASVSQLMLFGSPLPRQASFKTAQKVERKAPETKLNLKLVGLRLGAGSIQSSAIVQGPDKKQNIYYEGDELPSGKAVVDEIFSQHMIISRQGKYETLTLFSLKSENKDKQQVEVTKGEQVTDLTSNSFITKKLVKYKQLALKDASALNGMMKITPVMNGDTMLGYRLSPGFDARLFGRAGLKRNDVLTEINGVKLDSQNKMFSLMSKLAFTDVLDITIQRSGQPMSFRYKFK